MPPLRLKWKPFVAAGSVAALGVWLFLRALPGLRAVEGGPPSGGTLALAAAGLLLAVIGLIGALTPNVVAILRAIYGDDIQGPSCPVMNRCDECGTFNVGFRPTCKGCGGSRLRSASYEEPTDGAPSASGRGS